MSVQLILPRDTGVRLQIMLDMVRLIETRIVKRRWWQLWKPTERIEQTVLAEKPCRIKAGDSVALQQHGAGNYAVVVNEQTVLSTGEPTTHRYRGFGMSPTFIGGTQPGSLKQWSVDDDVSDTGDTVTP